MNKNKIALITGATSGIGESTSHKLSDQFSLILCGRNKKKLDELSNSLSKKTDVITLEFDVRDKKDVREKISSLRLVFLPLNYQAIGCQQFQQQQF